jgi:predicted transcriptional regulator
MEKKIERCSLGIIAKLPYFLNAEERQKEWGNQFMVAFYIINTMAINKKDRVKIYRQQLADNCNFKNTKSITNITNKLHQIGIIKKDFIGDSESGKTYNYYSLNWSKISELVEQLDDEYRDWWNNCTHLKNKRTTRIKEQQEQQEEEMAVAVASVDEDGEAPLPF